MVIKDKPHGFEDAKGRTAKVEKAKRALDKRYPKMPRAEQVEYMLGLGAGRVLALLNFEKKEQAEKKAKAAKKGGKSK